MDQEHLLDPLPERLEVIRKQLQELQQGEAEFIDEEWVRHHWGKLRQELRKEASKASDRCDPPNGFNGFNGFSPNGTALASPGDTHAMAEQWLGAGSEEHVQDRQKQGEKWEGWDVGSKIEAQDSQVCYYCPVLMQRIGLGRY